MNKRTIAVIAAVLLSMVFIAPSIAYQQDHSGAVYVMTNQPDRNKIVAYKRNDEGLLEFMDIYPTNGSGSGGGLDPLGSQGSLILSPCGRWLFAVNAGSDTISVFRIKDNKLKLIRVFDSGGEFPVSLAFYYDLLYVLNAGSDSSHPNIAGFRVGYSGYLIPLPNSTRELAPGGYHQVGFDPNGDFLVITEGDPAGENNIHVFPVNGRGRPDQSPVTSPSEGLVPFGFIFEDGLLLVSEAGSGAVTSYKILQDGSLKVINSSVANDQIATCWITGNRQGFVYTANTGSGTISAYALLSSSDGFNPAKSRLELLDAVAGSGNGPIDLTTAGHGRFLYVLNGNSGKVGMFRIKADGSLKDLGVIGRLPSPYAQGIIGR